MYRLAVITFRIPETLKEKLKEHSDINWSEFVREAIAKKIELEERKEAAAQVDRIKRSIEPVQKGQIDRWVKEDRKR